MYNRILLSMIAFGLAAFLMGGATMAWFTSTTSSGVAIQSGEVKIDVSGPANAPVAWSTGYSNMAPGQMVSSAITVKNTGTLPMKYRVWADETGDAGLTAVLQLKVKDAANSTLYSGALTGFTQSAAVIRDGGNIVLVSGNQVLTFEVTLPTSANNTVKMKTSNVTFHFDATQPENTAGWAE